jgi:hypothetical protein
MPTRLVGRGSTAVQCRPDQRFMLVRAQEIAHSDVIVVDVTISSSRFTSKLGLVSSSEDVLLGDKVDQKPRLGSGM